MLFEVSENGFDEVSVFRSEPIKYEAKYQITNVETKQNSDGIYATYRVVNVGNKDGLATDMNYISIQYNDLYNLTNEKDIYLKTNLGDLKAKEEVVATHKLDIEDDDIYYGRITSVIKVVDKDENDLSNYIDFNICLDKPLEVSVLEGREVVTIKVGESLDLNPYYSQQTYFKDGTFSYIVDDVSKVAIDGNKLVGLEEGETTVEVLLEPYGRTSEVLVKVVDEEQDTDVKVPQTGDYRDYSTVIVMLAILISVIILYYREKRKIRE